MVLGVVLTSYSSHLAGYACLKALTRQRIIAILDSVIYIEYEIGNGVDGRHKMNYLNLT